MTVPAVIQVSPISQAAAYSTARTVTFSAPVTAASTLILIGHIDNSAAASLAAVTASVSMTGAIWQRRLDQRLRHEATKGLTVWTASNVSAGATVITITPSLANALNYCGFVALEVSAAASSFEAAVGANTEFGVSTVSVGPAPASGSISQADTMAILASFINIANNPADPGWQAPSGYTERLKTLSSASGLRPLYVGTKTQTSNAAVTSSVTSTESDVYGRAGVLVLIKGDVGGAPPPSPPPPAASQGLKFTNVDASVVGTTGVSIQIHKAPTTEPLLGTFIQGATSQTFVLDGSKGSITVVHDGVVPVTTGQSIRAVAQNAGNTAGFRGVIPGTVVDL